MGNLGIWHYLFKVRSWLPCSVKMKRDIVRKIRDRILDFSEENPGTNYDALVERFGEPRVIAGTYVDELDTEKLLRDLRIRRRIVRVISAVALLALLAWGGILSHAYTEHRNQTGGYFEETLESVLVTDGEASGTKRRIYYDSNGTPQWEILLTASYSYTEGEVKCISSECVVTIFDTSWYVVSQETVEMGSIVREEIIMGNRLLGMEVTRGATDVWLTCTPNGYLN